MRIMARVLFLLAGFILSGHLTGFVLPTHAADTTPLDVVFALDNSGSMRTNDPKHVLHAAVTAFAARLGADDRLGIVSFDQGVHTLAALGDVDQDKVAQALRRIDYRGAWTDIPGGLEAARYELERHGRQTARKVVVLITDGSIDIGSPLKDRERKDWLESSVMPAVIAGNARVFGIAVARDADFELVQRMTSRTGGTYYAVKDGAELPGVFDAIGTRLREIHDQEAVRTAAAVATEAEARKRAEEERASADDRARADQNLATVKQTADAMITQTRDALGQAAAANRQLANTVRDVEMHSAAWQHIAILAVATGVLGIAVIAIVGSWRRRGPKVVVPAARLVDIARQTEQENYPIRRSITRIGALPGQDIHVTLTGVSRTHAIIEFRDGGFYLRDLRSLNGTWLGDQRLAADDPRGRALKHADEITFGRFRCRFVVDALQQAEEAPDPVRATVVLPGTMQRSEMVPTGAPAERSRWREPRDEMASSWRSAAAPAGLSGMCDAHHDRRADAVCSRCGRLICGLEEPTPDGNGGTACGAMVENGACPHAPVVTPS